MPTWWVPTTLDMPLAGELVVLADRLAVDRDERHVEELRHLLALDRLDHVRDPDPAVALREDRGRGDPVRVRLDPAARRLVGDAERRGPDVGRPAGRLRRGERALDALVVDRRDDDVVHPRERGQLVGDLRPALVGGGVEADLAQVLDRAGADALEALAVPAHAQLVDRADLRLLERDPRVVGAVELRLEVLAEQLAGDLAAVGVVDA